MASNVFPMLSSSPPPLDDCPEDDEDDDDDFGNFSSAKIPFDSSFDSPVGGEKTKHIKSSDTFVNNAEFDDDVHSFELSNCSSSKVTNHCDEKEDDFKYIPVKSKHLDISANENPHIEYNEEQKSSHFVPDVKDEFSNSHIETSTCDFVKRNSVDSEQNICDDVISEFSEFNGFEQAPPSDPLNLKGTFKWNDDSDENHDTHIENNCHFQVLNSCDIEYPYEDGMNADKYASYEDSSAKFTCHFNSEIGEEADKPDDFDSFHETLNSSLNFNTFIDHNEFDSSCDLNTVNQPAVFSCNFDCIEKKESFHEQSDEEFDDFRSSEATQNMPFTNNEHSINAEFINNDFECPQFSKYDKNDLEIPSSNEIKQDKEDFADFQDFGNSTLSTDDFADFEAVPFENNKPLEPSDSCEFADFEVAPSAFATNSFHMNSIGTSDIQKNADPLGTIINTIFPIPDAENEPDTFEPVQSVLEQSNKSRRLWEKLHEVEQTPSLRFQWGVSHSFQQLLRSINVDYHSILRMSSVPIFASGLSLLEPVKGLSSSTNHEFEEKTLLPKDPIPPVEFDWNSSGLINPLDSRQAVSTLMDLSFLSSVGTNNSSASDDYSLENELLKPSPMLLCTENHTKTQILDQLLSKNVSSLPNSKLSHRPSNLSKEAVHVLDQFPDLSFMQAKVLMFPISNKN